MGCKKVDFANEEALRGLPIQDVWGVGRRLAIRLRRIGVLNAWEFAQAPSASIRAIGGVTLERTQRELTGISCLEMEEVTLPVKTPVAPVLLEASYGFGRIGGSSGQLRDTGNP